MTQDPKLSPRENIQLKVWYDVSSVSAPGENPATASDSLGCDDPKDDNDHDLEGGANDSPPVVTVKARSEYSPDPRDYVYLGRTEYNQQCAACGARGVTYRERPQAFNVKRGTAGLCGACFEAISGRQDKAVADQEEVEP